MSNIGDNKNTKNVVWWVYMVRCADGTLYTGCTTDPRRRLKQHNGQLHGGARYTRSRRPVIEAGLEQIEGGRSAALKREYALKKMTKVEKTIWCLDNKWSQVEENH